MIVDSSALIAIVTLETDAELLASKLAQTANASISAATYLEAAIVVDSRRSQALSSKFDHLIRDAEISIEPVTAQQASIARQAYRDFGKGSGHRAQLNFGDCFAYALAVDTGRPLLFKGDDFGQTDVTPAV